MMRNDVMGYSMTVRLSQTNPFIVGSYVSPEYFCDRETEIDKLCQNLANGLNTVLLSPRRMGKTGLIQHLFHQSDLLRHFNCIYVDIFSTQSFEEFVYRLGQEVVNFFQKEEKWRDKLVRALRSLNFSVSYDPATNVPSIGFSFQDIRDPELTLSEIFTLLQSSDKRTVIAIDEFQQILQYKKSGTEATLRSKLQLSNKVNMIFAGSEMHTLAAMFTSYVRPFYQSATYLHLEAIEKSVYRTFATEKFEIYGKTLPSELFDAIYERFQGRTWYIHYVLNQVFSGMQTGDLVSNELITKTIDNLIDVQKVFFEDTLRSISPKQKLLLLAIATVGEAKEIQGVEFCSRFGLGAPASVQAASKALAEKGLITKRDGSWTIEDFFLAEWLKKTHALR